MEKWNKLRFFVWSIILIIWVGAIKVARYSIGQFYSKEIATGQFDQYTESYKMLRTANAVDKTFLILGIGFALFSLYMIYKSFKFAKKVKS